MKMSLSKKILAVIVLLTATINAQVGLNKTAQSTMNFLLVGTSPRAAALGEAFTAYGTGVEGMFYNPSGLAILDNTMEVAVNYTTWIADINYLGGGVAYNLSGYGVIGVHLITVDYGVINGTSLLSDGFNDPLGYIDNGPLSNVGAFVAGLTYAKAISQQFSIGGTVKIAGQNLGTNVFTGGVSKNNDATKLVFDAGVRYDTGYRGFVFGMSLRNFASNIRREVVDEQLPLLFSLGTSINMLELFEEKSGNSLILAMDFLHQNNYSERMNFGLEYKFLEMISLRGGYQTNRDLASWSGGIGINTSLSEYHFQFNYSYSRFDVFNSVNRLSIIFSF